MSNQLKLPAAAVLCCFTLIAGSCSDVSVSYPGRQMPGSGPPAHAPAYGRRSKETPQIRMQYDADLDIYVIADMADHYFCKGHYYRFWDGDWQVSATIDGAWQRIDLSALPPGLQKKAKTMKVPRGKAKGHQKFDK